MAEPNPKRKKMANPIGQSAFGSSSGTSPTDRKVRLIYPYNHQFDMIRDMPGFVDHTYFIRDFLTKGNRGLAIFAPRRFGKTTHLNMVSQFLRIDMKDKKTGEVSQSVDGPANGRMNYELFQGTRIISDVNSKDLVNNHLGRHPVIHLDLKGGTIDSIEAAEMQCRYAVHKAYLNHPYLETSARLIPGKEERNRSAQLICKAWCDDILYEKQTLRGCLDNLTRYLYNHFNEAQVYILVDEFDSINVRALHTIRNGTQDERVAKLQRICEVVANILSPVTKTCDVVGGALLTGVSYISGVGYSPDFNNLTKIRFLDGVDISEISTGGYVPFYGATREEIESLIEKLVNGKQLANFEAREQFLDDEKKPDAKKIMKDVQSRYNGYFDKKGNRIFCLWSVLHYLQSGDPINYWKVSDGVTDFYEILKSEKVLDGIINILKGGGVVMFERKDTILIKDLLELDELMTTGNQSKVKPRVVFNFLVDQGYLTYTERVGRGIVFKLPNAEVRAALCSMLGSVVDDWGVDTLPCTYAIDRISLSVMNDEKALQELMLEIYKAMSINVKELKLTNPVYPNEQKMTCTLYKIWSQVESYEISLDLQIKDDDGDSVIRDRPDCLMRSKHGTCSILWELKYNRDCKDERKTSLHALQEARELVNPAGSKKTKKYTDPLAELGQQVLVIGLSLNSEIKLSLSYAFGEKGKIFSIPEWECTSFPALYQRHNADPVAEKENDNRETDIVAFMFGHV